MKELAAPIPVEQRDAFLRVLAGELELRGADDVGPSELHRLCLEIRRRAGDRQVASYQAPLLP